MTYMRGPANERFDAKVSPEPNSGCWLWAGHGTQNGYGLFKRATNDTVLAHRFSYERYVGEISEGLQIDHLCRVRCCVNPDHLEVVTNEENQRRGAATRQYCKRGHSLADAYVWVDPRHPHRRSRICRICRKCREARRRDAV